MRATGLLTLVLTAMIAVGGALPPEHVHEVSDANGHHRLIEHRHVQWHLPGVSLHDGDHRSLDHQDAASLTLDDHYTAARHFVLPPPHVPASFQSAVSILVGSAHVPEIASRPIHGPPRRPSTLRAPPDLLAS